MKVSDIFKEGFQSKGATVPYKGYKIAKKEGGLYHVTKGSAFVGHGKNHQEAMKVVDKHKASEPSL